MVQIRIAKIFNGVYHCVIQAILQVIQEENEIWHHICLQIKQNSGMLKGFYSNLIMYNAFFLYDSAHFTRTGTITCKYTRFCWNNKV